MKRARIGDVLETSDNSMNLEEQVPEEARCGICVGEGPSDPCVEIWKEGWDADLGHPGIPGA